jgi:hypothetical protein
LVYSLLARFNLYLCTQERIVRDFIEWRKQPRNGLFRRPKT